MTILNSLLNIRTQALEGTESNDTLISGTAAAESIAGGLGADFIMADSGNDTIFGGRAIADAQDGADLVYGDGGNDKIYGNAGNDTLYGGNLSSSVNSGADTIWGGVGSDSIYGGDGNDVLCGGGGLRHPADDADYLEGGDGNDALIGNGGNDTLNGGNGADTFEGGLGNDSYDGGAGNDLLLARSGDDTMSGDTGADIFVYGASAGNVVINDFNASEGDRLVGIDPEGTTSVAQFLSLGSVTNGVDIVFHIDTGQTLTLRGVTSVSASSVSIISSDLTHIQSLIDLNV